MIQAGQDGHVTMETPGELSSLFGWLSTLPLEDVRIEPVGLRPCTTNSMPIESHCS